MKAHSPTFVAVVPPDLVEPATSELLGLGLTARAEEGGVAFSGPVEHLWRAALWARLPSRLRVRLGIVPGGSLDAIAGGIRRLQLGPWIHPRQEVSVTVRTGRKGPHRGALQRKVEHAIRDALRGPRRDPGRAPRAPAEVLVRQDKGRFELSLDATGEPLYRRGWKQAMAKAPLRETLASAVLWLADWDPAEALVDPMCGSGTLPIEAATIAAGIAPGGGRSFAFEQWPSHDAAAWRKLQGQRGAAIARAPIVAADRDPGAVRATGANARRAGVADRVQVLQTPVSELQAPAAMGLVVANPPYGQRVAHGQAPAAWRSLGDTLRSRFVGWRVALLVPDPKLLRPLGVRTERVAVLPHGGIRVAVHVGHVESAASTPGNGPLRER